MSEPLPHPVTGTSYPSPVPPGTGWPDDPASPATPVARTAAGVRRLEPFHFSPRYEDEEERMLGEVFAAFAG